MQSPNKTVIIIAGPTAVGKTAVGIAVARHLNTEIISADSRQCYRELNIGVARPSSGELAQVPHHFVASHSIQEKFTAADFEHDALAKTTELFTRNNTVVMVGGTGLYIKAFVEGLDAIPEVPAAVHEAVIEEYKAKGLVWLQGEVRERDPLFWNKGETQNPQRLMRALEVMIATNQSIVQFQRGAKKPRDFGVIKLALSLPKEELHHRIHQRVEAMIANGLIDEVKTVEPYRHLNALQTVGYKEVFAFLDGEQTLAQAVEAIKKNTRQYAKRQLTWFRKDEAFAWLPPDAGAIIQAVDDSFDASRLVGK